MFGKLKSKKLVIPASPYHYSISPRHRSITEATYVSITNIVSRSDSSAAIYFSSNSGYQYGSNIPAISGEKKRGREKKKNTISPLKHRRPNN